MDIRNLIKNAAQELAHRANQTASRVLQPVVNIGKYIGSVKPSIVSNLQQTREKINTIADRKKEFSLAKIQSDIANNQSLQQKINQIKENTLKGINQVNSKLPFGLSLPTSFSELNKRLEESMGHDEEYKRIEIKAYTQGYRSLTPEEQQKFLEPSMNLAMGMTSGVSSVGKAAKEAGVVKNLLSKMKGKQSPLQGLLSESPAQTAARRAAKVDLKEVYKGTLQKITQADLDNYVLDDFNNFMKKEPLTNSQKVGIFDYLKTPKVVLEKLGLKSEADNIAKAWDNYQLQLPKEIERIQKWMERVPQKGSEVRIFDYLDGKAKIDTLFPEEQKVAKEMRGYLDFWAKRLGLTEGNGKLSNYITHIFPKGSIAQEFDIDIARAFSDKVPSSIWNPFKQKRTNAEGYSRDVFQAAQAYTKRALRQAFVEPHLKALSEAAQGLDEASYKYVQKVGAQINMRPGEIDNLVDNTLKSVFGYKFTGRPTAYLTRAIRNAVYKGTLGLNVSSAIRNTSQLNNSYALLGEKYMFKGGVQFIKRLIQKDFDELYKEGVLNNSFIEDKTLSVFKQGLQKVDEGLWSMFSFAEKLNRGISYYGAKSKALAEGKPLDEAIKAGKEFVAKTQFKFGPLDTPLVLGSDTAKLFAQFQSYNLKQGEFLVDLLKSKNFPAIARYIGGNLAFVYLIGKTFGMDWKEMIPFSGVMTGETKLGQTPAISAISGAGNLAMGTVFGNEEQAAQGKKDLTNSIVSFIPAGIQAKKTITGIKAGLEGGVYNKYNKNDKLRFPTELNLQNSVFGPNVSETAQNYYKNPQPLSENQTELYKGLISSGMTPEVAYNQITASRGLEQKVKDTVNPDNSFNLFGFLKGKTETTLPTEKTGIFKYLDEESKQSETNKIISEIFANTNSPEQAQKALSELLPGVTYQDAMIQMVKSLEIEPRSKYLFEEMSKLTDAEFGKSLQSFVENKIIVDSVINAWSEQALISDTKAKQLKDYIKLKTGKKLSGPKKPKKLSIGKIKTKKLKLNIKIPKFKPLKIYRGSR